MRILKALGDGAMGSLLLPLLGGLVILLREALTAFGWGRNWMHIFDVHGIPFFVADFFLVAPLGFPLVAYLSYRFPQFAWRRDWWFVVLSELGMVVVLMAVLVMLSWVGQILIPEADAVLLGDVFDAIAYAVAAACLAVVWSLYRSIRVPVGSERGG